jgi:hypothetical protein
MTTPSAPSTPTAPTAPGTGAIVRGCLLFPALPAFPALSALELVGYLSLRSQYIVQCHDSDRRAVLVGYHY